MIIVSDAARTQLRQALLRHRQGFELSEAEYVKKVLKIALNTYKKCVEAPNGSELHLKRHTLVGLLKTTKLDPASLGVDLLLPEASDQYGGYDTNDFANIVGLYFVHRRSFLTAKNVVRGVLDIHVDDEKRCLVFEEYNSYVADSGLPDQFTYSGDIYINRERNLFSMVAIRDGQLRLMMTQRPEQPTRSVGDAGNSQRGSSRMRGALLTHGFAKNFWQPTVSAVAIESLPRSMWRNAREQCRTIYPDDPEFSGLSLQIAFAEDHATTMTPLMWIKGQSVPVRA